MRAAFNDDGGAEVLLARRVRADASRSVGLLRLIETTIEQTAGTSSLLGAVAAGAREMERHVLAIRRATTEIDPDDSLIQAYTTAQEHCAGLLERFIEGSALARSAASLREDGGLSDAYDQAAEAARDAFDALEDVKFAIQQHDALASGVGEEAFSSADAVIAHLRAL